MKVFKNLSPRQIARYIKSFHRGSFMVEALGRFEFSGGEINLQSLTCRQTLSLARQIQSGGSRPASHQPAVGVTSIVLSVCSLLPYTFLPAG